MNAHRNTILLYYNKLLFANTLLSTILSLNTCAFQKKAIVYGLNYSCISDALELFSCSMSVQVPRYNKNLMFFAYQ